ncbi:MAG: hypothetical protein HGGPFJEG_02460 [Ignavibacteria bacterium]|nr:hypothetical protein [Ignavibacteria bacterium]
MIRLYLDNCCFNRPYDDQSQSKIKNETDATLLIQERIINNEFELAWSFILDFENSLNPFAERKNAISKWKQYSQIDIVESKEILNIADDVQLLNINSADSLHVACSILALCDYFITTDDALITKLKNYERIKVINPIQYNLLNY